jgi:hypothetical protein
MRALTFEVESRLDICDEYYSVLHWHFEGMSGEIGQIDDCIPDFVLDAIKAAEIKPVGDRNAAAKAANELQKDVTK